MQERIIDFIVRNSRASGEDIKRLMTATDSMTTDIGTVIGGREAVGYGIIDSVGGLGDAVTELKRMISDAKKQ